jgi:hypothetical protein
LKYTIAERALLGFDVAETLRTARAEFLGPVEESEQALATTTKALTVTKRRTLRWGKR